MICLLRGIRVANAFRATDFKAHPDDSEQNRENNDPAGHQRPAVTLLIWLSARRLNYHEQSLAGHLAACQNGLLLRHVVSMLLLFFRCF
jgi:hypothetical protein